MEFILAVCFLAAFYWLLYYLYKKAQRRKKEEFLRSESLNRNKNKAPQNLRTQLPKLPAVANLTNISNLSVANDVGKDIVVRIEMPLHVRDLLWIKNGPLANYVPMSSTMFEFNGVKVQIGGDGIDEPSLIDITMPIIKPTSTVPDMGYYPSYSRMSPYQRFVYFDWLNDITKPINIGYVFVFYYGLERRILLDDPASNIFAKSISTIIELRKYHSNSSFQRYSANALIAAIAKSKNPELLQHIDLETIDTSLKFFILAATVKRITARDIMSSCRQFEFINTRYIKGNADLFESELKNKLLEQYNHDTYPIQDDLFTAQKAFQLTFANYSFNQSKTPIILPDITTSPRLVAEIPELLKEAHERVKVILAARRKAELAANKVSS